MTTRFQQMFHLDVPIIQSPMAGVQDSKLAIAVCHAGAMGSLPCAMLTAEQIDQQLGLIQRATDKSYNVNFFNLEPPEPDRQRETAWKQALTPFYQEYDISPDTVPDAECEDGPFDSEKLAVLEKYRPAMVSFHFGLPDADTLGVLRDMGARIMCSATTVAEAVWLESAGVDAIIAQGVEAGGHRGMFLSDDVTTQMGTFSLLPQIVDAVNLPVIAAGGIASQQGVSAALQLGASAVQIGTTFLLCDEADTSAVHRAALKSPDSVHTAVTNRFSGRPARSIANRLIKELGAMGDQEMPPFPMAYTALSPLRAKAESNGSGDFTPLWSGQNNSACEEIPAARMIEKLTPVSARIS
ncbi:MAG: nitronate monooxygenase [Pseudomonadota bacterium]